MPEGLRRRFGRTGRHRYGGVTQEVPNAPSQVPEPRPRRGPGGRRSALEERRRRSRRVLLVAVGAVVVLAILAAGVVGTVALVGGDGGGPGGGPSATPSEAAADRVASTLVAGTQPAGGGGGATFFWLISYDLEEERGAVVYIPAHISAEVPGRGSQTLAEAYATGGIALLRVSAENLLNVSIDRYLELSPPAAGAFLERIGTLTVDVPLPLRVVAGRDQARILFDTGPQELDPALLDDLLFTRGLEGDDAELGARHLAFWDAVFEAYSSDPGALAAAVQATSASFQASDAEAAEHGRLLAALAGAAPEDRILAVVPTTQVSAGQSELYRVEQAELAAFMEDTIGESGLPGDAQVDVAIFNGNGVPGIGELVGRRLVGRGFRIVLSTNAQRFTYQHTQIVTYDDTEAGLAAAREARELLGVGKVRRSSDQQDIVDLTIVVGKDFQRRG